MTGITVAVAFTAAGAPATGLTLTDIGLHLSSQHKATGAVAVIWDGTVHADTEVADQGIYLKQYAEAALDTYNYYAGVEYVGLAELDACWISGVVGANSESASVFAGPTLAVLRARCRLLLARVVSWPDTSLDAWLGEAIRFYSNEFPRVIRHEITVTTGTQSYPLPADYMGVVSVEYPAGQHPPRLLILTPEETAVFQSGAAAYAIQGASGSDAYRNGIIFAEPLVTGEIVIVSYLGSHWAPVSDDESTSVPEAHTEALIAFVDFRAALGFGD